MIRAAVVLIALSLFSCSLPAAVRPLRDADERTSTYSLTITIK